MIQNIIFDLGNVLLRFRPDQLIMDKFGDEITKEALMKAIFKAPEWLLMDRGTLSEAQATSAFIQHAPDYEEEIQAIMKIWPQAITPIEEHIEILKDMKNRGFRCYILSNFPKDAFEGQEKMHSFFQCFDGGVVSAYVHQVKPEKEIYESLLDRYELEPSKCLFLDDVSQNIEAAKALGIHGIQVTKELDLKSAVNTYLEANTCL